MRTFCFLSAADNLYNSGRAGLSYNYKTCSETRGQFNSSFDIDEGANLVAFFVFVLVLQNEKNFLNSLGTITSSSLMNPLPGVSSLMNPLPGVTNISKLFQFDLDVRHFSHEPPARVIAQALPVLDVEFHLHLHFIYIYIYIYIL